jgi:hypothetical protein
VSKARKAAAVAPNPALTRTRKGRLQPAEDAQVDEELNR